MNDLPENLSRYLLKVVNIVLFKNPERTAVGILFGSVISFFFKLFEPAIVKYTFINVNNSNLFDWILFGVLIVHSPYLIWNVFNKSKVDENYDAFVRVLEGSNLSDAEKREAYRKLVNKFLDNVILSEELSEAYKKILENTDA
jgi:hypothetical protein